MMLLTRSPIETMPRSSPPLITGRWRTRLALMIAMPSSIDLSGLTHTTSRTMISPTSVCGDARPLQKHVASVVPLGKDADDLAAVEHQQRADVLIGHHLDRVVHRVARMDGPYLMTLVIEDVTNCCHNRGQAGLLLAARTETVLLISSISALSLASRAALRRLDRFRESDILRYVFERLVAGCMVNGLVKGEGFAVDASAMEANASLYRGKAPDELDWTNAQRQKRRWPSTWQHWRPKLDRKTRQNAATATAQ